MAWIAKGDEVMLKPEIPHQYANRVMVVEDINWRYNGRNQKKPYLCRVRGTYLKLRFKSDQIMPAAEGQMIRALKGVTT